MFQTKISLRVGQRHKQRKYENKTHFIELRYTIRGKFEYFLFHFTLQMHINKKHDPMPKKRQLADIRKLLEIKTKLICSPFFFPGGFCYYCCIPLSILFQYLVFYKGNSESSKLLLIVRSKVLVIQTLALRVGLIRCLIRVSSPRPLLLGSDALPTELPGTPICSP